jgi:hypothetical protein
MVVILTRNGKSAKEEGGERMATGCNKKAASFGGGFLEESVGN